jgi:hypothetical protein
MIDLLIVIIIVLIICGLLIWAVSLLGGVGVPPQIIIALQIIVILIAVLILLNYVGIVPGPRWR